MAKQPEDLVVRILRDIQGTLAEHGRRFNRIEVQLEELHAGMIAALGLAQHADVRHNVVDKRLNQLKAQIERLAKKR